jgi:uncharacterized protein YndB with AHSA1/START domain
MASQSSAAAQAAEQVLVIERIFDAPRDLVWKAWADPARMVRWLGPRGFTSNVIKMDPWLGGAYRFHMRSPEGVDHWVQGVYREIVERERLVYTWMWTDGQGNPTGPETLVTVNFAEHGNEKTKLTLRQSGFESVAARDAHQQGWDSCLDRLAEYLPTA